MRDKPNNKCRGVCLTGWLRGKPCGASTVLKYEGEWYCADHYLTAKHYPKRFDAARKSRKLRLSREITRDQSRITEPGS